MDIHELILKVNEHVLNPLILLVFGVALLFFLAGAAQYIMNAASEEGRRKGSRNMTWGIVGMFIMFSVWGLIWVVVNTFGINADPVREFQPIR
jgi:phosphate starvation-inducible membrane PsiE